MKKERNVRKNIKEHETYLKKGTVESLASWLILNPNVNLVLPCSFRCCNNIVRFYTRPAKVKFHFQIVQHEECQQQCALKKEKISKKKCTSCYSQYYIIPC